MNEAIGPLFDTHCHLDFDSLSENRDDILARAKAAGLVRLVTIGAGKDMQSPASAVALAKAHTDWISATVAVHPHEASQVTEPMWAELEQLAVQPEVVAIGETGLDFYYSHSEHNVQEDVFRRFIQLARQVKKPIVVHTRAAAEATLRIMREEKAFDVGGIIHCFSEDVDFAKSALDLGFVASFSGIVTFKGKSAQPIQHAAKVQPIDSILIETDAPFLAPVPLRGQTNEPAHVVHTLRKLAELRGAAAEELCVHTMRNGCRVFGLPVPHGYS